MHQYMQTGGCVTRGSDFSCRYTRKTNKHVEDVKLLSSFFVCVPYNVYDSFHRK